MNERLSKFSGLEFWKFVTLSTVSIFLFQYAGLEVIFLFLIQVRSCVFSLRSIFLKRDIKDRVILTPKGKINTIHSNCVIDPVFIWHFTIKQYFLIYHLFRLCAQKMFIFFFFKYKKKDKYKKDKYEKKNHQFHVLSTYLLVNPIKK